MSYTNKRLGEELKIQLERGYDIVNISQWAYKIYLNNLRNLDPITEETLEYLFRMTDDPDFEYSESELKLLAEKLINSEQNPLKQINEIKFKST